MLNCLKDSEIVVVVQYLDRVRRSAIAEGAPMSHEGSKHNLLAGQLNFSTNDLLVRPTDEMASLAFDQFDRLVDSTVLFSGGVSGIYAACGRLHAMLRAARALRISEAMADVEQAVLACSRAVISTDRIAGPVEVVSGALSIGAIALHIPGTEDVDEVVLERIRAALERSGLTKKIGSEENRPRYRDCTLDFGMAHGLTGFVIYLSHVASIRKTGSCMELLQSAVGLLTSTVDVSRGRSPNRQGENDHGGAAWCYGPLMAGLALFLSGQALGSPRTMSSGAETVRAVLKNNLIDTSQFGLSLCHGLSGIFHIAHRFAQITKDDRDLLIAIDWLRTLLHSLERGGSADEGYRGYVNDDVGVAMALHSVLKPDLDWDGMIMCGPMVVPTPSMTRGVSRREGGGS